MTDKYTICTPQFRLRGNPRPLWLVRDGGRLTWSPKPKDATEFKSVDCQRIRRRLVGGDLLQEFVGS